MGDLTRNFSRKEFACGCGCGFDTIDYELVVVLQELATFFDAKVVISGPNRCFARNLATPGAARNSLHMQGRAADIKVQGVPPIDVYNYFNTRYPNKFGVGLYSDRVHIDTRKNRARWITKADS